MDPTFAGVPPVDGSRDIAEERPVVRGMLGLFNLRPVSDDRRTFELEKGQMIRLWTAAAEAFT